MSGEERSITVAWCESCEREVPVRNGLFLGHGKPAWPDHQARTGNMVEPCPGSGLEPLDGEDN